MPHFNSKEIPLLNSVGHLLYLANQYRDRPINSYLTHHNITAAQFNLLILIKRDRIDSPTELRRCLSIDSGALSRVLDRVEAKGLLRRAYNLSELRQVRLELTDAGIALSSELFPVCDYALNNLTQFLSSEEKSDLKRLLNKIMRKYLNMTTCVSLRISSAANI